MATKLPDSLKSIPIAKVTEESVLALITAEARVIEQKKAEVRAAAKARGMTEAEIDALVPPHPPGTFAI